ncbi:divergent polysaccharide deacetylase family protein [Marinomonas sp. RSW2]|uniref:Divergent polysaccharide deacetylase family protein n=1 Tax=Marinomonas maritima TaxID=2940935 RepID=A0ABT5WCA9_9GAMM|nr:divergent polysaccharide deacetylase family protein [Marinomonas maritima]MDE8601710.1 divergent polysaccharide deacetylase family protein [Marinomonas maritima]
MVNTRLVDLKKVSVVMFFLFSLYGWANELDSIADRAQTVISNDDDAVQLEETQIIEQETPIFFEVPTVLPEHLGPLVVPKKPSSEKASDSPVASTPPLLPNLPILDEPQPWVPTMVPFLDAPSLHQYDSHSKDKPLSPIVKPELDRKVPEGKVIPAKILAVDMHPKRARIAILIDDLGYSRQGMASSLALPYEVALAILPETPFALPTALTAKEQGRITLLHAPMENQRELKLGPGGLYANMTEHQLKVTLNKDLDGLPGIQGVNNHMGSLLTTKADSMKWVMEVLKDRSLFFIDSLTSPKSVAKKIAQEYGLKTVSRDVFLDNIRTEKAIDRQFSRLIKLARRHGSALAIGHPYPETMAYLKKRLNHLEADGVRLVRLSDVLETMPQHTKE